MKSIYSTNQLVVLFQHPSPTLGDRDPLAMTGKHCILSLLQEHVETINFIYDTNLRKELRCWSYDELRECFLSKVCRNQIDDIHVSEDLIISTLHDKNMKHPIFDLVLRKGWASLRNGEEHSFIITLS